MLQKRNCMSSFMKDSLSYVITLVFYACVYSVEQKVVGARDQTLVSNNPIFQLTKLIITCMWYLAAQSHSRIQELRKRA